MLNGPPKELRCSVIIALVSLKATNLSHCFLESICFAIQWQKGTLCFLVEEAESCCFCNSRNEMDSSFLALHRGVQKCQKTRFKVKVCSDGASSTEIMDVPIQRKSDFISASSLSHVGIICLTLPVPPFPTCCPSPSSTPWKSCRGKAYF